MQPQKYLILVFILLILNASSPSNSEGEEDGTEPQHDSLLSKTLPVADGKEKKRKRRCPGCKRDAAIHEFGIPSKDC